MTNFFVSVHVAELELEPILKGKKKKKFETLISRKGEATLLEFVESLKKFLNSLLLIAMC